MRSIGFEPIDIVAVTRHNKTLEMGNYRRAAEEGNYFLRGFNYLFLMQKKVYKQGWIMTMLKYGMIGTCYTILISCCAAAAFLVSLATV